MENKEKSKENFKILCENNENGEVLKKLITLNNYKTLKEIVNSLNIEILKNNKKSYSYRHYCKIYEAFLFKIKCGDGICCQAITFQGKRCQRQASNYTSLDLTKLTFPTLPKFIKKNLGHLQSQKLELIGFSNLCCFYCWQHGTLKATEIMSEMFSYTNNILYYTTHRQDIYNIFYKNIKTKKILYGSIAMHVIATDLRSYDEIVKYMIKTYGTSRGMFSFTYWLIHSIVYSYDVLKPYLIDSLYGDKKENEKIVEDIAVESARTILYMNNEL